LLAESARVVSLDLSQNTVSLKCADIESVEGDAEALPFDDDRFGVVASTFTVGRRLTPKRPKRASRGEATPSAGLLAVWPTAPTPESTGGSVPTHIRS